MSDAEILFEQKGSLGLVTLNRPKALNALTTDMCVALHKQLDAWAADNSIKAVAVVGAGDKAFCAGGDVRQVSLDYKAGGTDWQAFFYHEYRMNVAIDEFPKPYLSFVDGVTMGGGVGISVPGDFWIATEKTMFAMPETALGLFPDVGGGWFLPRLPGKVGMYLALTGARLHAADLFAVGLASHVVASKDVVAIVDALASHAELDLDAIDAILARYHSDPDAAPILGQMDDIDAVYSGESLADILARAAAGDTAFATEQAQLLGAKSPLSMAITYTQLRYGEATGTFRNNMVMEYRMVNRSVEDPDFHEGVRAILIDKDHSPIWKHKSAADVTEAEVARYFQPLENDISFG